MPSPTRSRTHAHTRTHREICNTAVHGNVGFVNVPQCNVARVVPLLSRNSAYRDLTSSVMPARLTSFASLYNINGTSILDLLRLEGSPPKQPTPLQVLLHGTDRWQYADISGDALGQGGPPEWEAEA